MAQGGGLPEVSGQNKQVAGGLKGRKAGSREVGVSRIHGAYFAAFSRDVGAGSEARKRCGAGGCVAGTGDCRVVNKRRGADKAASKRAISKLKEKNQCINNKHIKFVVSKRPASAACFQDLQPAAE